jgi:cyclophilin family peptidyl-prolyl cis-trans isomerase
MKLTYRNLAVLALILAAGYLYFNFRHNRSLPTGQIIQTTPIPLGTANISPAPITGRPQIEIATSKGNFIIELRPDLAENTVVNFMNKWAAGYCNFLTFHRVEDWVVQGCDPNGNGTGGKDILPTEISSASFTRGSVGIARKPNSKDKSSDSQFFIVKKDSPFLNGEYTYFGKVILGMDVVDSLQAGDTILSTTPLTK